MDTRVVLNKRVNAIEITIKGKYEDKFDLNRLATKIMGMRNKRIIKRTLLLKRLTNKTPITLIIGRIMHSKISQKFVPFTFNTFESSLFVRKIEIDIKVTAKLIATNNGLVDRGSDIKLIVPKAFTRKPKSIRNAMLSPTANRIVSVTLDLSIRPSFRITKPGTNVKKIKPEICRTNGISKRSAITATACIANMYIRNLGGFKSSLVIEPLRYT